MLFSPDLMYAKLASLLSQGWEFRSTELTEHFSWEDYRKAWRERALPLMAISPQGQLHPFADGNSVSPDAGWHLISIAKDTEEIIAENQ